MNKKHGMTIVELLVGMFVIALVVYGIYNFTNNASRKATIASTKGMLRQEAQVILRAIERDVASSRVKVDEDLIDADKTEKFKSTLDFGTGSLKMEIPKTSDSVTRTLFDNVGTDGDSGAYDDVTYSWGGGILTRSGPDGTTTLGRHVKDIKKGSSDITYDGKVEIQIVTATIPIGLSNEIEHTENVIIAIRQLQNKMLESISDYKDSRNNKYWRQKIRDE